MQSSIKEIYPEDIKYLRNEVYPKRNFFQEYKYGKLTNTLITLVPIERDGYVYLIKYQYQYADVLMKGVDVIMDRTDHMINFENEVKNIRNKFIVDEGSLSEEPFIYKIKKGNSN